MTVTSAVTVAPASTATSAFVSTVTVACIICIMNIFIFQVMSFLVTASLGPPFIWSTVLVCSTACHFTPLLQLLFVNVVQALVFCVFRWILCKQTKTHKSDKIQTEGRHKSGTGQIQENNKYIHQLTLLPCKSVGAVSASFYVSVPLRLLLWNCRHFIKLFILRAATEWRPSTTVAVTAVGCAFGHKVGLRLH